MNNTTKNSAKSHSQTQKTLRKFGLTDNEITVYLEALKQETVTPYTISRLTGIPRTTVYDILMNLSLKKLVELDQSDGFTKQQTLVKAKNPSTLRKHIRQKRKDLSSLEVDIVGILPQLKDDFHKADPNADFQFYPGIEGFRELYVSEEFFGIDTPKYVWDLLMPMDTLGGREMNKLVDAQHQSYKSHKHKPKELVPLNDWTKHVLGYQVARDPNYVKYREIRYLENPAFDLNVEIEIIGTWLAFMCAYEDEVWGLAINSKALSNTFKAIFLTQWMTATPVTLELVKSWGENEYLEAEKQAL